MNVLLLSPRDRESSYHKVSAWENVGLGLLYLSSALKEQGFTVQVALTDCEEVGEILAGFKPDVVGMTSVTSTYNNAIRTLEAVKAYDDSIITVMGGHHVTFTAQETLNEPSVDYVVRGEGEEVFPELLKNIMKGKPHALLDGVCFKKGGTIHNKDTVALVRDISRLPFPDRRAVEKYNPPNIYVLSSRGCPFKCTFCSASKLYGGVWRKRSVEDVLDELEGIKGIRDDVVTVQFGDETLTVDTRWAKQLCRGIVERGLKFKWYSNSRVDSITRDQDMLRLMQESGCHGISLGLESGLQEIIDSYHKGITLDQAVRAAEMIRKSSMFQQWYLMIGSGNEYDTPEYIRKSVSFMNDFPFDLVQISVLTPFPGTSLYDKLEREGRLLHKNWDLYDGMHCVYRPLGMTAEELEKELTKAYRQIYLHSGFKNFLRRIFRFKHAIANSRSFFTFLDLIIRVGIFRQDIRVALK
jgi:anaerobic magnesium-protoporphyrin IX monomethyl ester cyclase